MGIFINGEFIDNSHTIIQNGDNIKEFWINGENVYRNESYTLLLVPKNKTLPLYSTFQFSVKKMPDDIVITEGLTWISNNEEQFTVDSNGLITAVKRGLATMEVIDANGVSTSGLITII